MAAASRQHETAATDATSALPAPTHAVPAPPPDAELPDISPASSGSEDASGVPSHLPQRPQPARNRSSGTVVVHRHSIGIDTHDVPYDEGDARAMSPRRSSRETEKMGEDARQALIEQARALQASLLDIVDRVESVRSEHEKLEGGNRFLQSYIGELMQTSKITSTGAPKNRGRSRGSK